MPPTTQRTREVTEWPQDDSTRVVAARFADEGATADANAPLRSIVDLHAACNR